MAKEKETPQTTPDVKENTVMDHAGRIARGEKIRHPGPWVKITPRGSLTIEQEVQALQKEGKILKGFDPKTNTGIFA